MVFFARDVILVECQESDNTPVLMGSWNKSEKTASIFEGAETL